MLPVSRGRLRRLVGIAFAWIVRSLFGLAYYDTQCGAKVIRIGAARRIVPLLSARDFVFDVDLLTTARAAGLPRRRGAHDLAGQGRFPPVDRP